MLPTARSQSMLRSAWSRVRGLLMKPYLKELFHRINITPFIQDAERRATVATA
jgi:hypothetical protein